MSGKATTPAEREAILADLRSGMGRNAVARKHGRAMGTVTAIAKRAGMTTDWAAPKKAIEARQDYAQAERLVVLNELFDGIRASILRADWKPHEWRELATALGIAVDKRRLDDGEATSRHDQSVSAPIDRELARLADELRASAKAHRRPKL